MDPEFIAKLQAAFKEEASEHLQSIGAACLALEKEPGGGDQIEKLLRVFHSLKGSARAVNLNGVERVCQLTESILIRYKEKMPPVEVIEILALTTVEIQRTVDKLGIESPEEPIEADLEPVIERLAEMEARQDQQETQKKESPKQQESQTDSALKETDSFKRPDEIPKKSASTIRLPVDQLENYVKLSEELVYGKLASEQRISEISEIHSILSQWTRRWQRLRPELENLTQIGDGGGKRLGTGLDLRVTDLRDFVDLHDSFVGKMMETLNTIEKTVVADKRTMHNLIDSLLEKGRELTMVPFEVLTPLLERIVWDITRHQGKEISLKVRGSEVHIDRNILDELKDPIIHIIRNCIDHGIETTEERLSAGKEQTASLEINLEPIGSGKVSIEVKDDGRGIDIEKVKSSALAKRLVREETLKSMSEEQILALLFRSSFSTKEEVSDISGRGLGLTIVKENVDRLNGSVKISSQKGQGTVFRIIVPVRRATMVGITAKVGNQTVVIPTIAINSAVRLMDQDVRMLQGKWTLNYNERLLPVIRLADILQIESRQSLEESIALIVGTSEYPIALTVEAVSGEQEVAVKNLPSPLSRVRNIAGATQLKTGDLAVVINMKDVLSSPYLVGALTGTIPISEPVSGAAKEEKNERRSILVVEDSITSRVLLKNILESAGYKVTVASDGVDGFDKFDNNQFDLVITDVEMPRMNGFELTKKIRTETEHKTIPIIVVTSLASLEDRKRGVEVGASAYFVKSNFEKSNLLDMVKRLV